MIKKIFLVVLAIFVLAIISLEILSRTQKCKIPDCHYHCPASSTSFPTLSDLELANLKQKRLVSKKISKEEYRLTADKLILEENPIKMGCSNGKACGAIGFVRSDLPKEAKKFVKRHELEHLLQTGEEKNPEFLADLAAGREYPLGLIQTAYFSIWNRSKYYNSPICYISSLWKTFKIYFLPYWH